MELRRAKAENPSAGLIEALATVSEIELRGEVIALARPRHMCRQHTENRRAAWCVAGALEEHGYAVELRGELCNVVATARRAEGRPLLLVGAHYDSVPGTPGADDNVSGVATMLACA